MSPADEGYVKFRSQRMPGDLPWTPELDELNRVRDDLVKRGLIGMYPDGIGFGNLSLREEGIAFRITGTATGSLRSLQPRHWCRVEWFSAAENRVVTTGTIDASSESMTHGAIYRADPAARCVIHVHSRAMFDALLARNHPHTDAAVPYGTPAMADAITALVRATRVAPALFVTAGHDEGVIAYGPDIASTHRAIVAAVPPTA